MSALYAGAPVIGVDVDVDQNASRLREASRTEVDVVRHDVEVPRPWHKMRSGADRYLCGLPRGRYRGLPPQGGEPGPRIECRACEIVFLNLMLD